MSTEILEKFVYKNSFFKSVYNELTKIEHFFFDLPAFVLNAACTLDCVLQNLASNHSAERCLGIINYFCRQPNLSKPVNIDELFTYRLIVDKLEMIKSSYLLSYIPGPGDGFSEADLVTQSVNEKWVKANAIILKERLEAMFKRELSKFPIIYED